MRLARGSRRRGQSLLVAVVMLVLAFAMSILLIQLSGTNTTRSVEGRQGDELMGAARAGLAHTKLEVWEAYVAFKGGTPGSASDLRTWLEATHGLDDGETLALEQLRLRPSAVGGKMLTAVVDRTVRRHDDGAQSTYLVFRAEARFASSPGGALRTAETVIRIGGQPWEGFRYALLANNVNCIFCHAKMNTVERYYGLGSGPYQRIKVASLETLQLRDGSDSTIAGTLYVQGAILKKDGTPIPQDDLSQSTVGGAGGLEAEEIDSTGKIIDPGNVVPFLFEGNGTQFANFYKHYPTDPALQLDGALPDKFPSIIPDLDGNRVIDNAEWSARTGSMGGSISGGVIVPVPAGSTLAGGSALPTSAHPNKVGSFASATAATNVVLVGTKDDPIVLDGEVAVDGDVLISGYVKGKDGVLVARGNLYVVGDIIYADGDTNGDGTGLRTFGTAADGTQNNMAFGAAGNIIHGPYNVDKSGAPVTDTSGSGFTREELALFNRMEWTKTQQFYDPDTKLVTNTADSNTVPNAAYVAGHTPRYYTLDDSGTPKMFLNGHAWDNTNKVWLGAEKGTPNVDLTGGVLRQLNPAQDWISQANLATLIQDAENKRLLANGGQLKPYEIDGLLYTDNMIMMLARSDSSGGGQAIVNGAIISADAGILIPGQKNNKNEWDEKKSQDGDTVLAEAAMGIDLNNDGDKTDTVTLQQVYDNRVAWGWGANVKQTAAGPPKKFALDLNKDTDFKDKIGLTPTNPPLDGGLFLNYDVRTTHLLQIEDPTEVEIFTVSRREQ